MKTRKGLGKGLGMGYKNIAPMDAHIHSLSAKGVKYYDVTQQIQFLVKAKDKIDAERKVRDYSKTHITDPKIEVKVFSQEAEEIPKEQARPDNTKDWKKKGWLLDAKAKQVGNKYYKPIKTLGDLAGLDVDEAKKVLKSMGAVIKPLPKVDLGKLTLNNLNIDYTTNFDYVVKTKDGERFPVIENPNQEIKPKDGKLVVEAVGRQESLIKYAKSLEDEFKELSNKELKEYSPLGQKRWARSRDELLRRGVSE